MKRFISLVLAFVLLLSLTSCFALKRVSPKPKEDHNVDESQHEHSEEPQKQYPASGVPDSVTFPGEKVIILCREDNAWGEYLYEIAADQESTELVDKAVYLRNQTVKERLELESIQCYALPGHWAVNEDFTNTFKNSILAAAGAYDMIVSDHSYMVDSSLMDLYTNIYDVPYVGENLDADYYMDCFVDQATVNGKLYYALSDFSLTCYDETNVLYFNKMLNEQYNLENLYQLVRGGEWTYDKMVDMVKGKWVDLNGDAWPDSADSFGYVSALESTTDALWDFFDIDMVAKNNNSDPVLSVDQGKIVSVLENFIVFKRSDDTYFMYVDSSMMSDEIDTDKIFEDGRALFYPSTLNKAKGFRAAEVDFGILPYPKWDESQEDYLTRSENFSVAVFPVDAPNLALSGAVYDVMSAYSKEYVIPAFYDSVLKYQYSRDDESGEMLDIIFDGLRFNFGYIYSMDLGMGLEFRILLDQENSNFVSYYAVNQKGYERKLQKLIGAFE